MITKTTQGTEFLQKFAEGQQTWASNPRTEKQVITFSRNSRLHMFKRAWPKIQPLMRKDFKKYFLFVRVQLGNCTSFVISFFFLRKYRFRCVSYLLKVKSHCEMRSALYESKFKRSHFSGETQKAFSLVPCPIKSAEWCIFFILDPILSTLSKSDFCTTHCFLSQCENWCVVSIRIQNISIATLSFLEPFVIHPSLHSWSWAAIGSLRLISSGPQRRCLLPLLICFVSFPCNKS